MSPGEVASGTPEARHLADLAARYRPILVRFFQRRIPPALDPEDLVQEVFMRLAQRGDLLQISQIEGYLFQVAANVLRKRGARLSQAEALQEAYASQTFEEDFSPERILLGEEAIQQVLAALQELPERTRNVFLMHRFEDLKQTEIASRLGIGVSTVEKDVMRAMAYLLEKVRWP